MTDNRTTHDDNQLKQAHVEELLAAYREIRPSLLQLEQQAVAMLADSIRQQGIYDTLNGPSDANAALTDNVLKQAALLGPVAPRRHPRLSRIHRPDQADIW